MGAEKLLQSIIRAVSKKEIGTVAIKGTAARTLDDPLINDIGKWLRGEIIDKPRPELLYRGVPSTANEYLYPSTAEYVHGTPWAGVASHSGKGAFGSARDTKVYAFPFKENVKLYRGGSLEGDPLESTKILSAQGITWDDALNQAKKVFQEESIKQRAKIIKEAPLYGLNVEEELADKAKYVSRDIVEDLRRGTFETDLTGKPGIWSGKHVPYELNRETPKMRSTDDLKEELFLKQRQGYSPEDILSSPEALILKRSQKPDKYSDLLQELEQMKRSLQESSTQ